MRNLRARTTVPTLRTKTHFQSLPLFTSSLSLCLLVKIRLVHQKRVSKFNIQWPNDQVRALTIPTGTLLSFRLSSTVALWTHQAYLLYRQTTTVMVDTHLRIQSCFQDRITTSAPGHTRITHYKLPSRSTLPMGQIRKLSTRAKNSWRSYYKRLAPRSRRSKTTSWKKSSLWWRRRLKKRP